MTRRIREGEVVSFHTVEVEHGGNTVSAFIDPIPAADLPLTNRNKNVSREYMQVEAGSIMTVGTESLVIRVRSE